MATLPFVPRISNHTLTPFDQLIKFFKLQHVHLRLTGFGSVLQHEDNAEELRNIWSELQAQKAVYRAGQNRGWLKGQEQRIDW
jgi:hypothetical protein